MKLNLFSTLISQKKASLFLMILLGNSEVNAGKGYENCIDYLSRNPSSYGGGLPYQALLKYPFDSNNFINNGGVLAICCDKSNCSENVNNCFPKRTLFKCQKIAKGVFCSDDSHASTCWGGVIGDTLITDRTIGNNCTNKSLDEKNLKKDTIFTIDCYFVGSYENLPCVWDNGGWTCSGLYNFSVSSFDSSCYYQWPAQYPGIKCPNSVLDDNSKKIAIGVGTGVGVLVAGTASYVVWKKLSAKKRTQIEERASQQVEIEISELENQNNDTNEKDKNSSDASSSSSSSSDEEKEVKNVLLIGIPKSGKSTLANVITGTTKFDKGIDNKTLDIQIEKFKHKGIKYRIIDTATIDDNLLDKDNTLHKVIKAIYSVKGGLDQIFFVTDTNFSNEKDISTYNMLSNLFGKDASEYTTIIRTKFSEFENQLKCQEDKENMSTRNEELVKIIKESNGIIYVDNPPTDIEDKIVEKSNKKKRELSRERLLEHLNLHQKTNKSKFFDLQELVKRIKDNQDLKSSELLDLQEQTKTQIEIPPK